MVPSTTVNLYRRRCLQKRCALSHWDWAGQGNTAVGCSTHKTTWSAPAFPSCFKNWLLIAQLRSLYWERVTRTRGMFICKGWPISVCFLPYQGHMCTRIDNSHVQRHRKKMIPCVTPFKGHRRPRAGLDEALLEITPQHRFFIFSSCFHPSHMVAV